MYSKTQTPERPAMSNRTLKHARHFCEIFSHNFGKSAEGVTCAPFPAATNARRRKPWAAAAGAALLLAATLLTCAFAGTPAAFATENQNQVEITAENIVAQVHTNASLRVVRQTTVNMTSALEAAAGKTGAAGAQTTQADGASDTFANQNCAFSWDISLPQSEATVSIEGVRMAAAAADGTVDGQWIDLPESKFQSTWRASLGQTFAIIDDPAATDSAATAGSAAEKAAINQDAQLPQAAWTYDTKNSRVYAFFDSSAPNVIFEVTYSIDNAVAVFDDVAELAWYYMCNLTNASAQNVSATIQLPVPEGTAVEPGQNVRAWGHGPAGTVSTSDDGTVTYALPSVTSSQYAWAHVVFPKRWLTNLSKATKDMNSGTRLSNAVAEEEAWVDTASTKRINALLVGIGACGACAVIVLAGGVLFFVLGRERWPRQTKVSKVSLAPAPDARAASATAGQPAAVAAAPAAGQAPAPAAPPSPPEPAVAGRLARWNHISAQDFAATARQLIETGALTLMVDTANAPGAASTANASPLPDAARMALPANYAAYCLKTNPATKRAPLTAVQQATMHALFGVFGQSYQRLTLADIDSFAKAHPAQFAREINTWQDALTAEVNRLQLFDNTSFRAQRRFIAVACALAACTCAAWFWLHNTPAAAAFVGATAAWAIMANYLPRRTPAGIAAAQAAETAAHQGATNSEGVTSDTFGTRGTSDAKPSASDMQQFCAYLTDIIETNTQRK
jgi:hypothetical protein